MKSHRFLILIQCFIFSSFLNAAEQPTTAFFYGPNPPLDLLSAYDRVVLEPENITKAQLDYLQQRGVLVYAYLSIGEVGGDRPWLKKIQEKWKLGTNKAWNSAVMDMSASGWHDYLLNNRMKLLWQQGYKGFFLDTMDSYFLYAKTEGDIAKQQQGMADLIKAIKNQYTGSHLLFNRGFEVLNQVANLADGLIAESLFAGWNAGKSSYSDVNENDRDWLLSQLKLVQEKYALPVTVIDYLPPEQRQIAEKVAKKIQALGFTPWVSNPSLDYMGVGSRNLIPRKVLFLYNSTEFTLANSEIHRFLAMPLEYLGYIPDYWDINKGLPAHILKGRYAGIVSWLYENNTTTDNKLATWILQQIKQQVPIAFVGEYSLKNQTKLNQALGLTVHPSSPKLPVSFEIVNKNMGYEIEPVTRSFDVPNINTIKGTPWLQLKDHNNKLFSPVFISSWGGMALSPYHIQTIHPVLGEGVEFSRWIINPFEFLKAALKLEKIPVPDNTTENGNRILTIHIDGDGFYNKTQVTKGLYSSELIYNEFIKPKGLPHTVSIIEGEIGKAGLKPNLSPKMETIAKQIFKLDNVEIASHSFSHPFDWYQAAEQAKTGKKEAIKPNQSKGNIFKAESGHYHLPIADYTYSAQREIKGSVDYINQRLAPNGKKTKVFLWTGDCLPNEEALGWTYKMQLANLNGGDTIIREGMKSMTNVSSSGIIRGRYFQPYTPIQNENVYTNDWTGPFHGFQRVIETFQLTELPKRLKPISIYYHFYSGDRPASVKALRRVYDWAIEQETLSLWISEYVPRVNAFRHASFEKLENGWNIYGTEHIRTLRLPENADKPDLLQSEGVAGFNRFSHGLYLALTGDKKISLVWSKNKNTQPFLQKSNARIDYWHHKENKIEFRLKGHQPVSLTLSGMTKVCSLRNKLGSLISGKKQKNGATIFNFKHHDTGALRINCG